SDRFRTLWRSTSASGHGRRGGGARHRKSRVPEFRRRRCRFPVDPFDYQMSRVVTVAPIRLQAGHAPGGCTRKATSMRVMVLVKATPETEANQMPTEAELAEMGRYSEALANAGIMLGG